MTVTSNGFRFRIASSGFMNHEAAREAGYATIEAALTKMTAEQAAAAHADDESEGRDILASIEARALAVATRGWKNATHFDGGFMIAAA